MTTTWPDAILSVRFLTPEEGGRTVAVQGGAFYACPMFVGEDAFDCRLHLDGRRLDLGTAYLVSVRFLNRQSALARIVVGQAVTLWEGRTVATAVVTRIL